MPNRERKLITVFAIVVLIVTAGLAVVTLLVRYLYPQSIPLSLDNFNTIDQVAINTNNVFIADHTTSSQVEVGSSFIAEKVDFQRKLIIPESPQQRAAIEEVIRESGGQIVQSSDNVIVAQLPKENETEITLQLEQQNLVEAVEIDYPVFITADLVDWSLHKIEVPPVWSTTQASGVNIAVIDTGIDYTHPDLIGRYSGGYDFVNEDNDPYDDHGHGTHVAGIIAANADDTGIRGAASEASVAGLKVLAADGIGYVSDIIDAVDWAIDQNIEVINFSLGTTYDSSALESKLEEAQAQGIYIVAAAGNTNGGSLLYPAAYNSVIAVSATDQNDNFASFSSIGAEMAAPGVAITSTVPGGGYATWSGTSMAAPHISASIALMIANNQSDIRQRLHETALDLGFAGKDAYFGYGRVVAKPAVLGEDVLAPIVTFIEPKNNSQVTGQLQVTLDVQDEFQVIAATLSANAKEIARWEEGPFTFDWNTDDYMGQDVTLLASAVDDSGNIGAAQVMVSVVEEVSPSPLASSSPSPLATPSALPISQDAGNSGVVRQDASTPAQEVRQDTYRAPQQIPNATNINQRNPQPTSAPSNNTSTNQSEPAKAAPVQAPKSNSQQNSGSQTVQPEQASQTQNKAGKPDIKGASTEATTKGFWEIVWSWFVK